MARERQPKRTYAGELEYAIEQAMCANHDRNPNRYAQIDGWLRYGHAVGIARRGKEPLSPRPDVKHLV